MRRNLHVRLLSLALLLPLGLAAQSPPPKTSGDAAKLKNPIAANATSIAEGRQLFAKQCASCHGASGKGDGKSGATLKPKPADLTDETWKHGSTDGEIFTIIRDGVPKTGMKGFAGRMTTREMWNIVNYLRTLDSARAEKG